MDAHSRSGFEVVCLTASLGGLAVLRTVLSGLPAWFPVPILIAQHRSAQVDDPLVDVLQARSAQQVQALHAGEELRPGCVYLVPGGSAAVLVRRPDATLAVTLSPVAANDAADVLFASAARVCGSRTIVGVLTGMLYDGALGVRHVKGAGGWVLAQDVSTCRAGQMPSAALATGCVDHTFGPEGIAEALVALTSSRGAQGLLRTLLPVWASPLQTPAGAGSGAVLPGTRAS